MDSLSQRYFLHDASQSLSPLKSPPNSILGSSSNSSHNGFPIIALAIIGILAIGFLLVSYYIFVIKCCLNWHRIDLLQRLSASRGRLVEDSLMVRSTVVESRGLDEAVIRSIPILPYKKGVAREGEFGEGSFCVCAVCLNEFQEEEKHRIIPNCAHVFHIDCIDVWLQNNANCPLCRTSISAPTRFPFVQVTAPISLSPTHPNRYRDNFRGREEDYVVFEISQEESLVDQSSLHNLRCREEDYVVIEISQEENLVDQSSLLRVQERLNSGEVAGQHHNISPSPRKLEQKSSKKNKKLSHVSSMGDECIDIRRKDGQFLIQPIRRSFSMDSAADPHLYLTVQEIIQQQRQQVNDAVSPIEGCSCRVKRSFFSFGHVKNSRSAVLPVHIEP